MVCCEEGFHIKPLRHLYAPKIRVRLVTVQDNVSGQKDNVSKMSINAKHIIEVLVNHGQVQLSKHNIDVITQKVLNIKPLNIVLVGRDRQCSI